MINMKYFLIFTIILMSALITMMFFWNKAEAKKKTLFYSKRPIVLELFTSQGCSSCPPADRLLAEFAKNKKIIALSMHIDYWNYIGWSDPFSSKEITDRQRQYAYNFKRRNVYTPQMVIDGKDQTVGVNKKDIINKMNIISKNIINIPIELSKIKDTQYKITIPDIKRISKIGEKLFLKNNKYDLLLFTYDDKHNTYVKKGENKGVNLININVVRKIQNLATWKGQGIQLTIDLSERQGSKLIILQEQGVGQIIAVKRVFP